LISVYLLFGLICKFDDDLEQLMTAQNFALLGCDEMVHLFCGSEGEASNWTFLIRLGKSA
jgi:hypothetical protein